jgi:hypothetical protein
MRPIFDLGQRARCHPVLSLFGRSKEEESAMSQLQKICSGNLSRRGLLRAAVTAGSAVVALATGVNSAMAGKIPQSAVAYQGSPKGAQSCANCRLFAAPSACKTVDGTVSSSGWCRIYVKA